MQANLRISSPPIPAAPRPYEEPAPARGTVSERLPFTIRLAEQPEALEKAVHIRHQAYARHVPELAQTLRRPEAADHAPGAAVLLAESQLDGSPLGTLRIQSNFHGPMPVEQSLAMPDWASSKRLVEMSRLGVVNGMVGRLVKLALMKASYLHCMRHRVDWVIATGRAPIDRQYEAMLFEDLYPGGGFVPMRHVGNIPHRVMSLGIPTLHEQWERHAHPMFGFFFLTHHADIDIRPRHAHDLAEPAAMPAVRVPARPPKAVLALIS